MGNNFPIKKLLKESDERLIGIVDRADRIDKKIALLFCIVLAYQLYLCHRTIISVKQRFLKFVTTDD